MLKVYLVDDEYFVRTSLRKNIPWAENGFEVIGESNNGKTALEEIPQLCPDIAVVDINMPFYNGLELIDLLHQNMVNCKYIILTGYDEFKYAQKAIRLGVSDYILKPIDYPLFLTILNELKETILSDSILHKKIIDLESERKELQLEQYYNALVNCSLSTHGAAYYDKSVFSEKDLIPLWSDYTIAILKTIPPLLPDELKNVLSKIAFDRYIHCQDIKKRFFFIMDASDPELAERFLKELLCAFDKLMLPTQIGVGKPYMNFNQLYLSYNEAQIALQNHAILKKSIIYYKSLKDNGDYLKIDLKTQHRLKAFILDKNIPGIEKLLTEIFDSFQGSNYLFHTLVFSTIELIHILVDILSGQLAMPVSVLKSSDNILDILNNMNDTEEIKKWTIQLYVSSIRNFLSQASTYSNVTHNIEDFIQEHYSNPELTIPMIADSLYLNYSYLCSCFKRDKHLTINDYLNNLRIQKALELFQSGIDNVTYVSDKTGFNNSGYFSKRFKKMVGLTPSEYIKTI